jgi:endonuclease YncB( thermonuclease family)
VVSIADGDTVTVLDNEKQQHKVRLAGIDAPEKAQAFGNVSRQNLAQLVFEKPVTIEFDKLDKYKREIGKVLVGGTDANLEQVKSGLAWHYKQYQREQSPADRKAYSDAEVGAAASQRGLWQDANPVPPWEFRKAKHSHKAS